MDFSKLTIYTGRVQNKSVANFDITVMTGNTAFSPTWGMVRGIKNGTMSEQEFTAKYIEILDNSLKNNPEQWECLLQRKLVIICCYCSSDSFCHRFILAKYLQNLGATYLGEIEWE